MKKILLIAVGAIFAFSLTSCGVGLTKEQKAFYDSCVKLGNSNVVGKGLVKAAYSLHKKGDWPDYNTVSQMCDTMARKIPDLSKVNLK